MKKVIPVIMLLLFLVAWYLIWYVYSGLKFIPPHFHANFAMYIEGERVDFSDDKYMEDIAACGIGGVIYPSHRAHLHENNGETIHIHHEWVSFGHFFSNIWFSFGENYIVNDESKIYQEAAWDQVTFILNWKIVENPFNRLIKSEDRLLISYGSESEEVLLERYSSVSNNAGEYNAKYDPGNCWGNNENGIVVLIHQMFDHKH